MYEYEMELIHTFSNKLSNMFVNLNRKFHGEYSPLAILSYLFQINLFKLRKVTHKK